MEFIWGFIFGGVGVFIVMVFASRVIERGYERWIKSREKEIEKLNKWIVRGK